MNSFFVGNRERGILAASELPVYCSPLREQARRAVATPRKGGKEAVAWVLGNFFSPMHTSY
jgi:hypothetical protein